MYPAQIYLNISFLSSLQFPLDFAPQSENPLKNPEIVPHEYKSESTPLNDNFLSLERSKRELTSDNYQLAREAYEREVNDSITDYYAQRKAVMDRYHARQREIADKFRGKSTTSKPYILPTTDKTVYFYGTSPRPQDDAPSNNADENLRGYHQLGRRSNSSEETLVYQHNIDIGLKGQSDLNAAIEVHVDEPIRITCVQIIPSKMSDAVMNHLSGGVGYNFVKFKLTPQANQGLSYTIKIWGERP